MDSLPPSQEIQGWILNPIYPLKSSHINKMDSSPSVFIYKTRKKFEVQIFIFFRASLDFYSSRSCPHLMCELSFTLFGILFLFCLLEKLSLCTLQRQINESCMNKRIFLNCKIYISPISEIKDYQRLSTGNISNYAAMKWLKYYLLLPHKT